MAVGSIKHAYVATGTDAGNGEVHKAEWNAAHTLVGIPYVFDASAVAVTGTAITTEEVYKTITVTGGLLGPNGWAEVWTVFSCNNNANQKQCKVRAGGVAGTTYQNVNIANLVSTSKVVRITNINSQSSQKGYSQDGNASGLGSAGGAVATSSVDTSANWDIVISGTKAVAGDTLTLEAYQVIIWYGA